MMKYTVIFTYAAEVEAETPEKADAIAWGDLIESSMSRLDTRERFPSIIGTGWKSE